MNIVFSGNIDWWLELFTPDGLGISWLLSWPVLSANLLFFCVRPALFVIFFRRFSGSSFRRGFLALYLPLSALSYFFYMALGLSGLPGLLFDVLLLTLCGYFFCCRLAAPAVSLSSLPNKRTAWLQALIISILIFAVNDVCHGILKLFSFWIAVHTPLSWSLLNMSLDTLQVLFQNLLFFFSLLVIHRNFYPDLKKGHSLVFAILAVPLLYISLVERTIQDSLYGNTIIFNTDEGICFPVVDHAGILFLQLFAYLCLFLTLAACQHVQKELHHQQILQILEQQRQSQESYIQETHLRYEQTRSFRHDIRNHLTVLEELLNQKDMEHAHQYLLDLKLISSALSAPVNTGNAVVNALLRSKLTLAGQADIPVICELTLPNPNPVSDIDWCILLANAIDNAIKANELLPAGRRHLSLSATQKGNFFLLSIENPCQTKDSHNPSPGIGLSNIQAVMEKYQGKTDITFQNGSFRLQLLFCFPP